MVLPQSYIKYRFLDFFATPVPNSFSKVNYKRITGNVTFSSGYIYILKNMPNQTQGIMEVPADHYEEEFHENYILKITYKIL